MKRAFWNILGLLAAAVVQFVLHAAISALGAHPFPVIGLAWLHLIAFLAGGYAGGAVAGRAWPAVVPAACFAAAYAGVDLLIDPGVSVSTLALAGLGLWGNVWAARRSARAVTRRASSS
jgi:hypothetical protein